MNKRINKVIFKALFVMLFASACIACSNTEHTKNEQNAKSKVLQTSISTHSLLVEMLERDAIAKYPAVDFRLKQQSSYNRASTTAEDPETWFLNHDFNSKKTDKNFIRIEENQGRKEWVLMDAQGPGALVRTWMPWRSDKNPSTNAIIRFYIDGANEPELEGNMFELLDGTGDIPFPLAHQSLRSAVSFFPIAYAKGLKITVSERPFFYQMTYREYDQYAKVRSFSKKDFETYKPLINNVSKKLRQPSQPMGAKTTAFTGKLTAGEEKSFTLPQGAAAIKTLSLQLNDYGQQLTRAVVLKIEFDGTQTVYTPISEFFGIGVGLNPFEGWYRTAAESGKLTSRWVMPYQKKAKISLVNMANKAVEFKLKATVDNWQWDERSMYFHASWRGEYPVATRPFSDWNYVNLQGRGVYVGDTLTIWNPVARWWGEGDEKIFVDGEKFPSIFGTGTEDYYGYSWGGKSTDFYQHPFHAQPASHVYNKLNRKQTDERNTFGYSVETRTRALDTMPFATALKLDMEVWHWEDVNMGYAVGAYWYGDLTTANIGNSNVEQAVKLAELESTPVAPAQ